MLKNLIGGAGVVALSSGMAFGAVNITVAPGFESVITLDSVSGTGTVVDPIVINETWNGPGLFSALRITGADQDGNPAGRPEFAWSIRVLKNVTNNTGFAWALFDNELRESLGVPSPDPDGLSFGQEIPTIRPSNNIFPNVDEEDLVRDFVQFNNGENPSEPLAMVMPGQTLQMEFYITDNSPTDEFFLLQSLVPTPGALGVLGLAGVAAAGRRRR